MASSSSSAFADLLPGAPLDLLAEGGGNLSRWFWNDEVWLPPNVTWEDLRCVGMRKAQLYPTLL